MRDREWNDDVPYLVFVIRVLTANEGKMTDEVRALLNREYSRNGNWKENC